MATAPKKGAPQKAAVAAKSNGAKAAPQVELEAGELSVTAKLSESKMKSKYGGGASPVLTVAYNFGADLDDAVEKFGAETVFNSFVDRAVINLQGKLRRHIEESLAEKDPKPLPKNAQDLVGDWVPAAGTAVRKSPSEKVSVLVGKLSAEDRAALIERLKAGL